MSGKTGNDMQWGGMMPPAPAPRSVNQQPSPVMPPLPPVSGLSIFDDFPVDSPMSRDFDSMESKSDSENEGESIGTAPSTHPDDVLQGELLRTADTLSSKARADSFYLVYSARSKLVKVGVTLYTYEECSQKYTKLYGHLDNFHFLKIENDMTRERLERAFYQFFSETRMYNGKEFFQPFDTHGRLMVPIYLSLLTKLTTSDLLSIRRFYLMHGTTALAAKQWIEAQHMEAAVELSPAEVAALSNVRILSTVATSQLARAVEQGQQNAKSGGAYQNAEDFYSSSDEDSANPASATAPAPAQPELTDSDADGAGAGAGAGDDNEIPVDDLQDRLLAGHARGAAALSQKHDQALAPAGQSVSLYLVHSVRAELVKVGFATGSYEECKKKYTALYGRLDGFYFFAVENDLLTQRRTRLEKLFYRLFAETRTTPGGPFFAPKDRQGRDMVPLYVTVLKALSAADTTQITQFYRRNRLPSAMQNWVDQQHTLHSPSLLMPSQPSPTTKLPPAALNFAYQNSAPPAVTIVKNTSGALAARAAAANAVSAISAPPLPTGSFEASDLHVEDL